MKHWQHVAGSSVVDVVGVLLRAAVALGAHIMSLALGAHVLSLGFSPIGPRREYPSWYPSKTLSRQ
jgi:hypothetical protein